MIAVLADIHAMEDQAPQGSYVMLEQAENDWNKAFIHAADNHRQAAAAARQQGWHDWAGFLATGRAR